MSVDLSIPWQVIEGDCLAVMPTLPEACVDAVVTDPPYGLAFMGKAWDHGVPGVAFWAEALRVAKPGAHLLAFGGTRTFHRLTCAIENAGWEIRDCLSWLYGSGFPKSHNGPWGGTALKPAWEPIVMARKPLSAPSISVRGVVEYQLRQRGIVGDIKWTTASEDTPATADAVSRAAESERPDTETATERKSGRGAASGPRATRSASSTTDAKVPADSGTQSSEPTDVSARAAVSASPTSSPSTISGAEAPGTAANSTARSTPACADSGSPLATERFAGIATGLVGSMASVSIERSPDGTFVWPSGLPLRTSGGSTVAANHAAHGTGALNIDGCRIATGDDLNGGAYSGGVRPTSAMGCAGEAGGTSSILEAGGGRLPPEAFKQPAGRWPANVVLDEAAARLLDAQSGALGFSSGTEVQGEAHPSGIYGSRQKEGRGEIGYGDSGGASRFFYTAKASRREREAGLREAGLREAGRSDGRGKPIDNAYLRMSPVRNTHPTVKPVSLMRWLLRLVTPAGGLVLDPFSGSGTTGVASAEEGFRSLLIEREPEYVKISMGRVAHAHGPAKLPLGDPT